MPMSLTTVEGLLRAQFGTSHCMIKRILTILGLCRLRDYFTTRFANASAAIYKPRDSYTDVYHPLQIEGRAVDLTLDGQMGSQAFDHAVAIACQSGIQEVVFNGRSWAKRRGEHHYVGTTTRDGHVYIGLNRCGAENF